MKITQKITALLDAPHYWQTGFQDPASISMEGILVFNKHLMFLLVVFVLFVGWFLACIAYYFVEFNNHYNSKSVGNKKKAAVPKEVICTWVLFFVILVPFIICGELFQISVTRLDPAEAFQEVALPSIPEGDAESPDNSEGDAESSDNSEGDESLSLETISWLKANVLADDLAAQGYSRGIVMQFLAEEEDESSFWLLDFADQLGILEDFLTCDEMQAYESREAAAREEAERVEAERVEAERVEEAAREAAEREAAAQLLAQIQALLEESAWRAGKIHKHADQLVAKGYSRQLVVQVIADEVGDSFWLLEDQEQLKLLEKRLVAETSGGIYRKIIAVAVCGIAAIAVAAACWWFS
jgi:hypothetical protein